VARVERDVGATGLESREDGTQLQRTSVKRDSNARFLFDAQGTQPLQNGQLVLRLAKPAAVIVEPNRGAELHRFFCYGANTRSLGFHARLLFILTMDGLASTHHPKLHAP